MSTAGAHAGAINPGAGIAENPAEHTAVKVARMKRRLREIRTLCETMPDEPLATDILAILDREG